MAWFLPLSVLVIWMASPAPAHSSSANLAVGLFLGSFFGVVIGLRLWSQRIARAVSLSGAGARFAAFHRIAHIARLVVPVWFAGGVFFLGWKAFVGKEMGRVGIDQLPIDTPALLLGCLPAFAAWIGLWWAQYPSDLALREQNLLVHLEQSLPIQNCTGFLGYLTLNVRLQLLFTIAPALILVLIRDGMSLLASPILNRSPFLHGHQSLIEAAISLPALAFILLLGPEVLRRVLRTRRMPQCPLRQRLENICRQNHVRFRDILLWETRNQMGNAAVMGFIPRVRYILLSDLLLETMSDEQIEAVFAHEVGHILHRHMFWLVAAIATVLLAIAGPGSLLNDAIDRWFSRYAIPQSLELSLLLAGGMGLFLMVLGFLSRSFERQADVFAARVMQDAHDRTGAVAVPLHIFGDPMLAISMADPSQPRRPHGAGAAARVGRHGAQVFCSALVRVAAINNIPVAAPSWCHGSIARRMHFLNHLGQDPRQTQAFDHAMGRIYTALICLLCLFAAWTLAALFRA